MEEKNKILITCLLAYLFNLIDFFSSRYLAKININAELNNVYKWLLLNNLDLITKIFLFPILLLIAYKICISEEGFYAKYVLYAFVISISAVCLNNTIRIIQYKGGCI